MRLEDRMIKEIGHTIKKGTYTRSDNGYSQQDPESFMKSNFGKKNLDGSWSMERDLILRNNSPIVRNGKFIIKIKSVFRNFNCSGQDLITLEGGPEEVGGNFWCDANKLTSLEYGPLKVGGIYSCIENKLTDLKFLPKKINDDLNVSYNLIKDFSTFPRLIKGDLDISSNKFKNFIGIPNIKGCLDFGNNPLKTYYGLTGKESLVTEYNDAISKTENAFIASCLSKGKVPTDYYEQLFNYTVINYFEDIKKVKWPKGFLNTERKRLINSKISINKFML